MAGIRGVDYIDKYGNRVVSGGKLTAQKNLAKDPDYYRKLGSLGGKAPTITPKGFAANKDTARSAGFTGGRYSRKGHKLLERTETSGTYRRLSDGAIVEIKY